MRHPCDRIPATLRSGSPPFGPESRAVVRRSGGNRLCALRCLKRLTPLGKSEEGSFSSSVALPRTSKTRRAHAAFPGGTDRIAAARNSCALHRPKGNGSGTRGYHSLGCGITHPHVAQPPTLIVEIFNTLIIKLEKFVENLGTLMLGTYAQFVRLRLPGTAGRSQPPTSGVAWECARLENICKDPLRLSGFCASFRSC
jgi:hypothetical protein